MANEYHINREDELVSMRVTGATGLDDMQRLAEEMLEDPEYHAFWPHLIDLRGMQLTFSDDAASEIVEFLDARFRPNVIAPIAVVIDGDLDAETCADIFHLTCTVDSTELFDDFPLAIKWLIKHNFHDVTSVKADPDDAVAYTPDDLPTGPSSQFPAGQFSADHPDAAGDDPHQRPE